MPDRAWPARYVGLPYRRMGRDREGVDCWGLARLVLAEQCGIALPSYDTVPACEEAGAIAAGRQAGPWHTVGEAAMREFDFVIMRHAVVIAGRRVAVPSHIGIAAPDRHVLHVREDETAVLQPFATLKHRVTEICRHEELAEWAQ